LVLFTGLASRRTFLASSVPSNEFGIHEIESFKVVPTWTPFWKRIMAQWKPFTVITLGPIETNNINQTTIKTKTYN
jgi:hypothetical protein